MGSILDRSHTRLSAFGFRVTSRLLSKLSGCVWVAETGVLRLTGGALVRSLIRYCFAVVGSGLYEQSLGRFEVGLLNI